MEVQTILPNLLKVKLPIKIKQHLYKIGIQVKPLTLLKGLEFVTGDSVLFMDFDQATPIDQINNYCCTLKKALML